MPDIPRGARTKVSKAFGLVLARGAVTPHDDGAAAAYHLFVRWVLRRDGWHVTAVRQGKKSCSPPPEEAGAFDSVPKRAQAFLDGRWQELHAAYLDTVSTTAKAAAAAARGNAELRRQESACAKVGEGAYSKGMAALLDKGAVEPDGDVALAVLTPLHPTFGAMSAEERAEVKRWLEEVNDPHTAAPEDMAHALATAAKAAAPGPSGMRTSHLRRMLLENQVHLRNFTAWTNGAFCTGMLPDAQRNAWAAARSLALGKEVGGHRPISMGDASRRATGRAALLSNKADIQLRFRGKDNKDNLQLGCMTPNGSENVVHDLSLHLQLNPTHTLLHIDVTNAFNTQHRYAFLKQVHEHFPALLPLCAQFYMYESDLLIWGKDGKVRVLKSSSGQQQGDTLGSFLFCLGIHPILEAAHAKWPSLLIRAICDDIHVAGPDELVALAFTFLRDELKKIGLQVKYGPKKTCCLLPNLPTGTDDYNTGLRRVLGRNGSRMPAEVVRVAGGMEVLGSFVGSDEWVTAAALAKVEDGAADKSIKYACSELAKLAGSEARNARDIAGSLLRACVVPKMGYLCRTVRPDLLLPAARAADDLVARTFCQVYHINTAIFSAWRPKRTARFYSHFSCQPFNSFVKFLRSA